MPNSNLTLVKKFVARRYMNEENASEHDTAECVSLMLEDFGMCTSRMQSSRGYSAWIAAQKCAEIINYDKIFNPRKTRILKAEEVSVIVDLGLHFHFGSPVIDLSWQDVDALQQIEINQSLQLKQIPENCLPNSLWIEISGNPSAKNPNWICKTVGILLTKIPLDESKNVILGVKNLPHWEYIIDLLNALCECEGKCLGYFAMAAQSESTGFRFIPTIFGHEETGTVGDILQLHKEITQTRKFKEIERFTAQLCVRAILTQHLAKVY